MQSWVPLCRPSRVQSSLYFSGYYWLDSFYSTCLFRPDVKWPTPRWGLHFQWNPFGFSAWRFGSSRNQQPPVVHRSCSAALRFFLSLCVCVSQQLWQWVGLVDVMGSPWPVSMKPTVTIQTPSLSLHHLLLVLLLNMLFFVTARVQTRVSSGRGFSESRIVTLLNDSGTFSRQTFRQQIPAVNDSIFKICDGKKTNKSALGSERFISWWLLLADVSLIQTTIDLFTRRHCELLVSHIINTSTRTSSVLTGWTTSFEQLSFRRYTSVSHGNSTAQDVARSREMRWERSMIQG